MSLVSDAKRARMREVARADAHRARELARRLPDEGAFPEIADMVHSLASAVEGLCDVSESQEP